MIESITFKDPDFLPKKNRLSKGISHEFFLPALRGKTFTFKRGLNIVVGENGCGKTSLLRVIRKLWMCEHRSPEMYSHFLFSQFFNPSFAQFFDDGLYEGVEMRADFRRPMFNLRKPEEVRHESILDSVGNALQFMESSSMSKGENTMTAISMLVNLMIGKSKIANPKEYFNFSKVLSRLQDSKSTGECAEKVQFAVDWYRRNHADLDDRCLTATMDEPDAGMDIYRLDKVRSFLETVSQVQRDQFIVAMHNVALIRAMMELPNVHFIELSPGYLEAIKEFGNGEIGEGTEQVDVLVEREEWLAKNVGGNDKFHPVNQRPIRV